jgi:hypothetical protein
MNGEEKSAHLSLPHVVFLCVSLLLSLGLALFVERPVFGDASAINDDVRNQAYWMVQLVEHSAFQGDLIADYFTQPSFISPVVWWLYRLASAWMDPLRFSQFLPFPLILLTTFFLFKFAENHANARYAAWVCWLFNLFIWTVRVFSGGLPRAFFYPLLFLFLWQYEKRNILLANLCLCLCSLIYPPALLLILGLIFVDFWMLRKTSRQLPPAIWCGILGCVGIGLLRYAEQAAPHFGRVMHLQAALQTPELFPNGRIPLFLFPNASDSTPWHFLQMFWQILPHLYITVPAVLLFIAWKFYRKRFDKTRDIAVPPVIWRLAGVSVFFYLLAWVFLFYLYVPERYLQFSLPVVIVFVLAWFFNRLSDTWAVSKKRLVALWLIPLCLTAPFWKSDLIHPSTDSLALMRFFKTTPKYSMISGNLGVSSNIPPLARRSVFLSHEGYIPFHQGYFREMKTRLRDWLSAYYAQDAAPLRKFIKRYPTDYMVVDVNDYEKARLERLGRNHYQAFEPSFFQQLKLKSKSQYLLYRLAKQLAIYRNDTYLVVKTADIKAALR